MSGLTGTGPLLRVSLHQDARAIAPWVVLISVLSASSVLAYALLFPDAADRAAFALALGANPALSLVFGPARDLATADGFNAWRAGQLGSFFAGLMTILLVVRNSRAPEDSGQAELFAAGVLGRTARLAVALLMALVASVALGLVCFGLTVAVGGGVAPTAVIAAGFTASGLVFAGVAALAAQVGQDARTASSMAVGTLGVLYVLRGYLDSSGAPEWTTWLTPFGWVERTRAATENDPVPLLAALVCAALLVAAAFTLQAGRDFAQGVVAPRRGPERAGAAGHVWGLAWRLNRGALAGWAVGFVALGFVFGNIATSVADVIADNPVVSMILAQGGAEPSDLTFAFIGTILQVVGIVAAVLGVQVVMRLWAEEVDLRVEPLLAGSLRRRTYLASVAVVAFVGSGCAMVIAGTGLGLVASSRDQQVDLGDVVLQAVATVPAVWVLVALALLVVGAAPHLRVVAWLGVVATFALTLLGPTFRLPSYVLDVSPLRHVPQVTQAHPGAGGAGWLDVVGLGLVVVLLTAGGFVGFRRRDVL